MFYCWSWLGCLSIKSLKAWMEMNSKSKSDEISPAASDGSNFSIHKLVPRKYFLACIWCIASRALCGEIKILFGRLTPYMQQASCYKMYMASCYKMYMPLFPVPQPNKTKACWKLFIRLDVSPHLLVGRLLCRCTTICLLSSVVQISSWEVTMWYFIWPYYCWWWTVTKSWPNKPRCNQHIVNLLIAVRICDNGAAWVLSVVSLWRVMKLLCHDGEYWRLIQV